VQRVVHQTHQPIDLGVEVLQQLREGQGLGVGPGNINLDAQG
jgi:hypothetical protein